MLLGSGILANPVVAPGTIALCMFCSDQISCLPGSFSHDWFTFLVAVLVTGISISGWFSSQLKLLVEMKWLDYTTC